MFSYFSILQDTYFLVMKDKPQEMKAFNDEAFQEPFSFLTVL